MEQLEKDMNAIAKNNITMKKAALFVGVLVAASIVVYPFLPAVQYSVGQESNRGMLGTFEDTGVILSTNNYVLLGTAAEQEAGFSGMVSGLASFSGGWSLAGAISENAGRESKLVIPKIGVDMPIAVTDNEHQGLDRGAWLMPNTSTPDRGGNTAFAAHRFRYVPPSSKTFYLLDKVTIGDDVQVVWNGKEYWYRVTESKIVPPTAVEVLNSTSQPTITLITCDPLFSTANRMVVTAVLVEVR